MAAFIYPSYVQDIMGPMCFDYGFGPFRWVCTSSKPEDLGYNRLNCHACFGRTSADAPEEIQQQMKDNIRWIREAKKNKLVVVRRHAFFMPIVKDRIKIAAAFNKAIKEENYLPLLFLAAIIMMFQELIHLIGKLPIFMTVPIYS